MKNFQERVILVQKLAPWDILKVQWILTLCVFTVVVTIEWKGCTSKSLPQPCAQLNEQGYRHNKWFSNIRLI